MSAPRHWYQNAIIYGLDVETFHDSDGDGVGDFQGLIRKLDYFTDLGVNCLWLLPFFPTPNRDNGYDVADYLGVDPRLGTLQDFIEFARRAKERGIRVMIDLVVNHTSTDHPWFQAARLDDASGYRNYYIWTKDPPPIPPEGGTIFEGEENTVWTYDEAASAFYYHRFYHHQPSLNASNPRVVDEIQRILDFWLSIGADAMRMDAVSHLIQGGPTAETKPDSPQGILRDFRRYLDERSPDAAMMGEADEKASELDKYFGEGDQLHMLLNFLLNNYLFLSLARKSAEPVRKVLELQPAIPANCQWANFLRNMDEVDLERLAEEERQEVYEAFAPKEEMRIFGRGVRRRLAPMLGGDERRILLAFSLLLSLPGAPVIIYGDEIGMGEDLEQKGREAVRTPMQWTTARNAGFSDAKKSELVRAPISGGRFGFQNVNVEAQRADERSLRSRLARLLRVRSQAPEIGLGRLEMIETKAPEVLAHMMHYHNVRFLAVHNLSEREVAADFTLAASEEFRYECVGSNDDALGVELELPLTLEPYGVRWYRGTPRDG